MAEADRAALAQAIADVRAGLFWAATSTLAAAVLAGLLLAPAALT